jgi:Uma2 family endonuclease
MYFELKTRSIGGLTDDQFFAFCQENSDLQFERTANGEIIFIMPTGGETGFRNTEIITELNLWNRSSKIGKVFDSSTGFKLPNTATRSPDAAWVSLERWKALSEEDRKKFPPLCPDFVIELMSESDSLHYSQDKMKEWMENGCRLGWLIDINAQKVYVYHDAQQPEVVPSFEEMLSGEEVLKGFTLDLKILK